MTSQPDIMLKVRAEAFRALHQQSDTFLMPCAWDAFSAILFEQAGATCVGTTSGGVNWARGRRDYVYTTPCVEMLATYKEIANATSLPVSADLENGYGDSPDTVAETIRASIAAGIVGGSIEDQQVVPTDDECTNGKLYPIDQAVARIQAAREAADSSAIAYTLTARCEVYYVNSVNRFAEAVDRLNAYSEAGADCLFVPGLNDLSGLKQLVAEVEGPVSFGMGATKSPITTEMLQDIGIRRISTGGGLTRATFTLLQQAAEKMLNEGTFDYLRGVMTEAEINDVLTGHSHQLDVGR